MSESNNLETAESERMDIPVNAKLTQFISAISDKNYANAHKYLKSAVETKLTDRINSATDKPLFKHD